MALLFFEKGEQKTKEFQDCISPIMSKLYQGQGGEGGEGSGMPGGMPGGMPDMSNMDPEMMAKMASAMGGMPGPGPGKEEPIPGATIDEVD